MASVVTVGDVDSPFIIYSHCFLPSAHCLAFNALSLFSKMNTNDAIAFLFSSSDSFYAFVPMLLILFASHTCSILVLGYTVKIHSNIVETTSSLLI